MPIAAAHDEAADAGSEGDSAPAESTAADDEASMEDRWFEFDYKKVGMALELA